MESTGAATFSLMDAATSFGTAFVLEVTTFGATAGDSSAVAAFVTDGRLFTGVVVADVFRIGAAVVWTVGAGRELMNASPSSSSSCKSNHEYL
jgi:hypothetical protein